jgi:uncharacterized protein (UPF0147 family)
MSFSAEVELELDRAAQALADNNIPRERVCCRRAAGAAIRQWVAQQAEPPAWGRMAITQLRTLAEEDAVPAEVRWAAARLSTTVSEDHTLPFDNDPVDDALIIIRHFVI